MEKLLGTTILKENAQAEPEIILNVREFFVLFYGGAWDGKTKKVAESLTKLLNLVNGEGDEYDASKRLMDVLYVSNDKSQGDMETLITSQSAPYAYLPWNDDRILDLKETYNLVSVPQVIVLDRNMSVISREGADDLLKMTPTGARAMWINALDFKLERDRQNEEDEEDM